MKIFPAFFVFSLSILTLMIGQAQTTTNDWHQWRGPENNGVSSTATPPLEWSEKKNLAWKAEIGGKGTGTPIVVGDKVFITTAINTGEVDPSLPKPEDQPERVFGIKHPNTNYEMVVLCYDRRSGVLLWRDVATRKVPHEGHHKDASFASASPFCDGERLYCWFGSAGLFAYSLEGKKLWERDLGPAKVGASLGEGSSPVVHGGKLILVRDHAGQSTIECLDARTGKTLWKKNRDEGNAWATPAIAEHNGTTQVITTATKAVRSYSLENGELIWKATGLTNNSTPCPIVDGTTVYCMTGYQGHALLAIPITGTGDVTDQIRWEADRGTPYVPSAVLYGGQLYFTQSNQGILTSLEAKDGTEVIARTRVPDLGDIYASPVAADGRVYLVGRKGSSVVIEAGKEFKILASNQLDDNFHASPALAGKQLFLRGTRFLYCLEEGATRQAITKRGTETAPAQSTQPADPKKALGANLKALVEEGRITGEESIQLYLTAFPEERENVMRWLASLKEGDTNQPASAQTKTKPAPKLKPSTPPTTRELLLKIASRELPKDYPGDGHQAFVDRWFASAPSEKSSAVGQLWKAQQRLFPDMENKGGSFIRILDYVRSGGDVTTRPGANSRPAAPQPEGEPQQKPVKKAGRTGSVSGQVLDAFGKPMGGVMVSAFDDQRKSISVFSQADGRFHIDKTNEAGLKIRARLSGQRDQWIENVKLGDSQVTIKMEPATGSELEEQRPATDAFAQLTFESPRDRLNFKMMCSYCHQIGTVPFRSPEEPVDWETMITRMDGFGGLYKHTQDTIVERLISTYKDDAVDSWSPYVPPAAPTGMVTQAKITSWELGEHYEGSYHDLELGPDGLVYAVNIRINQLAILDPETNEQRFLKYPKGTGGAHSIEQANDKSLWTTMCGSGHMARYDVNTGEFLHVSSAEAPAKRGSYPHTLRIDPKDPEGLIWYTDAGRNSVFSLHPATHFVKEYHLLDAGQVKAGGKGESRGITPYGLDYSPVDGMIWYSKLNGNRIGRINPKVPDGDITEWNPPFRGPRRLHVAPDGMVWVPGFGSGVFGKFDPTSEEWTTYPLPDYLNQIPYALNVAPDGMVWICGTGNDTLYRFNPETEYLVEFPLPFRVSYTREIEFDEDGNVWTSTSGPARHMENVCGSIIKLELPNDVEETGGLKLSPIQLSLAEQGILSEAERAQEAKVRQAEQAIAKQIASGKYDATPFKAVELALAQQSRETRSQSLSTAFGRLGAGVGGAKLEEVIARIESIKNPRDRDSALNGLAHGLVNKNPEVALKWANQIGDKKFRENVVAKVSQRIKNRPTTPAKKPNLGSKAVSMEKQTSVHRLDNSRRSAFDAFVYVNRIPNEPNNGESPEDFAGRIQSRLANQEGRIQIKLPSEMARNAYLGFKHFLNSEAEAWWEASVLSSQERKVKLQKVIQQEIAAGKADYHGDAAGIEKTDIENLLAFLSSLEGVTDEEFRTSIINAEVLDTSKDILSTRLPTAPSIKGTVRFEGPAPERQPLPLDAASRQLYKGQPALDENILISPDGGLANVFVYVTNPPSRDYPSPNEPAIIDQQKSMFVPRVQGLRVGQELVMKNGDPFIHNIRSLSMKNRPFNVATPANSPDRKRVFETAEGPITAKCDFHPWMTAHFWVMDHPFFAVTDRDGRFSLPKLPPGDYTLTAWHEMYGTQETRISIGTGTSKEILLTFRQKD